MVIAGSPLGAVAPAAGWLGLLQEGKCLAEFTKLFRLALHAHGDALHRAKQIHQHRHGRTLAVGGDDVFKQHRRPAFGQKSRLNLGHLEIGAHRLAHADELAILLQTVDEIAQGSIGHSAGLRATLAGCNGRHLTMEQGGCANSPRNLRRSSA